MKAVTLVIFHIKTLLVALSLLCVACGKDAPTYIRVEGEMLGTFMQVSASTDRESSEIYAKMMQIDSAAKSSMSIFDENSLLSRVNRNETDSLDEHIIQDLLRQGAQIDMFGVGERLITAKSEPVFGGVYKVCAVENKDGTITPKIKISETVETIGMKSFEYCSMMKEIIKL